MSVVAKTHSIESRTYVVYTTGGGLVPGVTIAAMDEAPDGTWDVWVQDPATSHSRSYYGRKTRERAQAIIDRHIARCGEEVTCYEDVAPLTDEPVVLGSAAPASPIHVEACGSGRWDVVVTATGRQVGYLLQDDQDDSWTAYDLNTNQARGFSDGSFRIYGVDSAQAAAEKVVMWEEFTVGAVHTALEADVLEKSGEGVKVTLVHPLPRNGWFLFGLSAAEEPTYLRVWARLKDGQFESEPTEYLTSTEAYAFPPAR